MSVFDDDDYSGIGTTKPDPKPHGNTRTFQWYQDLRRKDPRTYYKGSTQQKLLADRIRLGEEAFYAKPKGDLDD